jgi:hypothetical protein
MAGFPIPTPPAPISSFPPHLPHNPARRAPRPCADLDTEVGDTPGVNSHASVPTHLELLAVIGYRRRRELDLAGSRVLPVSRDCCARLRLLQLLPPAQ